MKQHKSFLATLQRVSKNKRKRNQVISVATQPQLNTVRNFCHMVCRGKVPMPPRVRSKLQPHRDTIRELASKSKLKSLKGLRKRLIQKGGFLPIVLPLLLSLISTVGGKAISKAVGL
jgi:hypothetical protein